MADYHDQPLSCGDITSGEPSDIEACSSISDGEGEGEEDEIDDIPSDNDDNNDIYPTDEYVPDLDDIGNPFITRYYTWMDTLLAELQLTKMNRILELSLRQVVKGNSPNNASLTH